MPKTTKKAAKIDGDTPSKTKQVKRKPKPEVPRGVPKSGRVWKTKKEKFSKIKNSIYRRTVEKKEELRNDIKHIKEVSKSIKDQKRLDKEAKKERRLENERRRQENERKSEVVQIIKNPAKLKRIRKKQLRMIEKRDLSTVKVV